MVVDPEGQVPPGYYSFVNAVRCDTGVSGKITIPKLGPMGAFQSGLLRTDNYSYPWTGWSVEETREMIRRNGIGHIITQVTIDYGQLDDTLRFILKYLSDV
jgi:hypothetical protein